MFQDKVVVITGGAGGIGKCIADEFRKQGAAVCVIDCAEGDHFVGDIADKATLETFAQSVIEKYGRVDVLVNNAPPAFVGIDRCSYEQFQQALAVGVTAPFYLSKLLAPHLGEGACIVNISSSAAHGNVGQANYSASKAAILGLTKTLAREFAAKGVTVNAVSPCFIETDMMNGIPEALSTAILRMIPMHRMGTADELASAVFFLTSDDSRFVTGIELPVNGGMFT